MSADFVFFLPIGNPFKGHYWGYKWEHYKALLEDDTWWWIYASNQTFFSSPFSRISEIIRQYNETQVQRSSFNQKDKINQADVNSEPLIGELKFITNTVNWIFRGPLPIKMAPLATFFNNTEIQWLAEKLDFLAVCDLKWGYFESLNLKNAAFLFFKLCA